MSIDPVDVISTAATIVAGGLLALAFRRWYGVADGGPGIGDDDPRTMRPAIVTLTVWAVAGARLFGLL